MYNFQTRSLCGLFLSRALLLCSKMWANFKEPRMRLPKLRLARCPPLHHLRRACSQMQSQQRFPKPRQHRIADEARVLREPPPTQLRNARSRRLLHTATIDAAFRECSLGGSKKRLLKEVNLKFKELLAKTWTLDGGGKAQKSWNYVEINSNTLTCSERVCWGSVARSNEWMEKRVRQENRSLRKRTKSHAKFIIDHLPSFPVSIPPIFHSAVLLVPSLA